MKNKTCLKYLSLCLLVLALALAGSSTAKTIELEAKGDEPLLSLKETRSFSLALPKSTFALENPCSAQKDASFKRIISREAAAHTEELGKPLLPLRNEVILLPADVEITNVELIISGQEALPLDVKLAPVQPTDIHNFKGKLNEEGVVVSTEPLVDHNPEVYNSAAPYPPTILQKYSQEQWGAFDILNITYSPFQYLPAKNELQVITKASVEISYREKPILKNRRSYASGQVLAMAKTQLLNADMINEWYGDGVQSPMVNPIDLAIIRPDYFLKDLIIADYRGYWVPCPTKGIFATSAANVWTAGYPEQHGLNNMAYNYTDQYLGELIRPITLIAQENGQKAYLEGVAGLANGTVVSVGYAGNRAVIFTRMPSSDPWVFNQVTLPGAATGKKFYSLSFTDPSNPRSGAWVVGGSADGSGNVVFRATDITNPDSWSQMTVPATPPLHSVYAATGGEIWAVGEQGTILYYNGSSWSIQASGVTTNIHSISGSAANDIWTVGDTRMSAGGMRGMILHYNGSAWEDKTAANPDSGRSLNVVKVLDPAHVFIAGEQDYFMMWEPLSQRWIHNYVTHKSSYDDHKFNDISFINAGEFVMVSVSDTGWPQIFYASAEPDAFNNYLSFRQAQGYQTEVKKLSEIVAGYTGENLYQRIQAYLVDRYVNNSLSHVMLAGSSRLVPNNHDATPYMGGDYQYRDVIDNGEDNYELFVARIPRDDASEIQNYLQRAIDAESRVDPYRNKALLANGCYDGGGTLCTMMPGETEGIKNAFYVPMGFDITTLYEHQNQSGQPSAYCQVESTDELSEQHVIDRWTTEHPYFVSMTHHGGPGGVTHTWGTNDAQYLNNAYASHVWAAKPCSTANPGSYTNMASNLIWRGAISYLGAYGNVECSDTSNNYQKPFYGRLINEGQTIAEAFNFTHVGGPQTLLGDPLTGYAGGQGHVVSFYYPVTPYDYGIPTGVYRGINEMQIIGSVLGPGFTSYAVEWGQGSNPAAWSTEGITLLNPTEIKVADVIAIWDTSSITDMNDYSLRITAYYGGLPVSRQITFMIDNQACQDATPPQECSATQPRFCEGGVLIDKCSTCGCPNAGYTCTNNGNCIVGCADGTPQATCSETNGFYCPAGGGELFDISTNCGSLDGAAHTLDDCRFCEQTDGQYCDTATGLCLASQSNRGLKGKYYQGANFNTLITAGALDPIMDFGGGMSIDQYLKGVVNERVQTTAQASVRWEGYLYVPANQSVTYYLNCKNGNCKFYLDNMSQALVASPIGFGASAAKTLGAGWYRAKVEFQRQATNNPSIGLQLGRKVGGLPYGNEFPMGQSSPIPLDYIIPHKHLAPALKEPLPVVQEFNDAQ